MVDDFSLYNSETRRRFLNTFVNNKYQNNSLSDKQDADHCAARPRGADRREPICSCLSRRSNTSCRLLLATSFDLYRLRPGNPVNFSSSKNMWQTTTLVGNSSVYATLEGYFFQNRNPFFIWDMFLPDPFIIFYFYLSVFNIHTHFPLRMPKWLA